ncbi:hypothetical protein BDN70DRAFT_998584 [Pholiota conissans]|uniref:Uncharacterized protein n=1 Tax=Pholiota conissans TaxID=109636 RepID=A0A9P6CTF9_9AGAR|nr:hypothetical protein BDN70DRAFT_998584 [Pholiota conissans]
MLATILTFLKAMFGALASSSSLRATDTDQEIPPCSIFLPLPPNGPVEIGGYMRNIVTIASSTIQAQEELAQHMVSQLEHMKDTGRAQHEHIIATVTDHNQHVVRLSIGRNKSHETVKSKKDEMRRRMSFNHPFTLSASFPDSSHESLLKPSAAMDAVTNIGNKDYAKSHVLTTFKPTHGIPLLRLVVIAKAVHDRSAKYTILRNQCYWFAMLVMGVSMSLGGEVKSKPAKGKSSQDWEVRRLAPLLSDATVDLSKFGEIPIHPEPEDSDKLQTVEDLEINIGMHNGIRVVALSPEEIRYVAFDAQQNYQEVLDELSEAREGIQRKEARLQEEAQRKAEARFKEQIEEAQRRAEAAEAELLAIRRRQVIDPQTY